MEVAVRESQTIFDIAIEYYGTIEGVYDICQRNNFDGVTIPFSEGEIIEVSDVAINHNVRRFIKDNLVKIDTFSQGEDKLQLGLGYARLTSGQADYNDMVLA